MGKICRIRLESFVQIFTDTCWLLISPVPNKQQVQHLLITAVILDLWFGVLQLVLRGLVVDIFDALLDDV